MKRLNFLVTCFFAFFVCNIYAQEPTQKIMLSGTVYSAETQKPIPKASILVKGSKKGIVADSLGNFSISVEKGKTILVTYLGFEPQEIKASSNVKLEIKLVVKPFENEEVVVIGYGTAKKSNVTGAVSKYKNDKLDEHPVIRLDQALQGIIAGVQIQNTSSEAGADPQINIRGISSINAGASPLVVVDGQPVPDGLAFVNMADVESVEVLKDAASAAIYGSRGASGVILITTKSGKPERTKYSFKYAIGRKTDYKRYDIMTSTDYLKLLFAEQKLKKADPLADPADTSIGSGDRASYIIEQEMLGGNGTDWQSESLKPNAFNTIQLSATGGKKEMTYFISGAYLKDGGMMYKSNSERYTFRTKLDINLNKNVKLSVNINPSFSKKESPSENFTNFARYPSFLPVYHNELTAKNVNQVAQWASVKAGDFAHPRHFSSIYYKGFMPDGSYWDPGTTSNPSGSAQNNPKSSVISNDNNANTYRLQSSLDLSITLKPGLVFKSMFSNYINYSTGLNWANRNANEDGAPAVGIFTNATTIDLLSENTLTYNKAIKNHSINVLAGYTLQQTTINKDQAKGSDFPSDNIRTLSNALIIDKAGTFSTTNKIGLRSYLARVSYTFKDRYLLTASIRSDGSSYFAPGRKWGSFPSLSLGWIASQEKFFENVKWVDRLKFRASIGKSGNNRIVDFAFLDLLSQGNYSFGLGTGNPSLGQVGSTSIIANPNITWESTVQNNFGIDLTILKNKINLSIDIYKSETEKLLLQQSAQAFTGVPYFWNNNGSLKNTGFEIELSTINISKKKFKWTTSANFSKTRNEILELGKEAFLLNQGERTEIYQNKVGDPLVQFYGFKTDGVWLSQTQIDEARGKGLTSYLSNVFIPGGLKVVDINGDNKLNDSDRTIIGSPYPDFTWGITNTFSYKSFDLSFTFQGVQGGQLINGDPNYVENKQKNRAYNTNRWVSPSNPGDGKTPYSTSGFNWLLSDYVVEDASYFALRDINLGYKLPSSVAKFVKLSSLRVYLSAQNLFFHSASSYRGLNPEGRATSGPYASALLSGYQRGSFPINKTFIFGLDINF